MLIQKPNQAKITTMLIIQHVPAQAFNRLSIKCWLTSLKTEVTESTGDHVLTRWQIHRKKGVAVLNVDSI